MAYLNDATFVDAILPGLLLEDLRNQRPMLQILMDSPVSKDIESRLIAAGDAGGFAKKITVPLLKQHALDPTDGYSTETNFPSGEYVNPDLSSAYPESNDYPVIFSCDKVIVGTHFLPDMRKWTWSAGSVLQQAEIRANQDEIADQLESAIISDMISSTVYAAGSAKTQFALATTAEADLNDDFKLLHGEFNRQNIPKDQRYIAMPTTSEGVVVKWASLKSRDYVDPISGDARTATWQEYAGFKLVFTNNMSSSAAVAFSPVRYAFTMPKGIVLEQLRDKDRIGDYTRMYGMFGMGSISEVITGADATSPTDNIQRVGLISCSLS